MRPLNVWGIVWTHIVLWPNFYCGGGGANPLGLYPDQYMGFKNIKLYGTSVSKKMYTQPLTHQINCSLLNFLSTSIFKVLQCCSKLVNMLPECQTAWI